MTNEIMTQFLDRAADRPYRELIQSQIKKQSASKLQKAVLWETSTVPENLQKYMMEYIDMANSQFSYDQSFWQNYNWREAYESIIEIAIQCLTRTQ
jgi:6-pyruvoyl-tetrahydropterin synthase